MAVLLTDDGRPLVVDEQRLDEIALLSVVMIAALARSGTLTQVEIDALLARAPGVARLVMSEEHPVPHPDAKMQWLRAEFAHC